MNKGMVIRERPTASDRVPIPSLYLGNVG